MMHTFEIPIGFWDGRGDFVVDHWREVEGETVRFTGLEDEAFFIHEHTDGWRVTDPISGGWVCEGQSNPEAAYAAARDKLASKTPGDLRRAREWWGNHSAEKEDR